VHRHQGRLYKEIQEVCGNETVTEDDLPRLPYLNAVLHETLIPSPAAGCLRVCIFKMQIETQLFTLQQSVHHDLHFAVHSSARASSGFLGVSLSFLHPAQYQRLLLCPSPQLLARSPTAPPWSRAGRPRASSSDQSSGDLWVLEASRSHRRCPMVVALGSK
jgi:hypothetical protein